MTTPLRFVDADVNKDPWGLGDSDLGGKWAFLHTADLLTTFQFRVIIPTGVNNALGNNHVTLKPALLPNYYLLEALTVEGAVRYWSPIGGTDCAGDIRRHGCG